MEQRAITGATLLYFKGANTQILGVPGHGVVLPKGPIEKLGRCRRQNSDHRVSRDDMGKGHSRQTPGIAGGFRCSKNPEKHFYINDLSVAGRCGFELGISLAVSL